jgi:transcriptional regulator of acetoin/glycerol metabolism
VVAAAQRAAAIVERMRGHGIVARHRARMPPDDVREPDRARALDGLYPGRAERERIIAALAACRGNQTRAAAILGMSRRTLIHRLERYALPRPRKSPPRKG